MILTSHGFPRLILEICGLSTLQTLYTSQTERIVIFTLGWGTTSQPCFSPCGGSTEIMPPMRNKVKTSLRTFIVKVGCVTHPRYDRRMLVYIHASVYISNYSRSTHLVSSLTGFLYLFTITVVAAYSVNTMLPLGFVGSGCDSPDVRKDRSQRYKASLILYHKEWF